jgi:formylglycine-generating enzyme required for sulfatase activity
VTPPAPSEPTLPPEALAMHAAPTATPSPIIQPTDTLAPTATSTSVPTTGSDDVLMVEVPAGNFSMGISTQEHVQLYESLSATDKNTFPTLFANEVPKLLISLPAFSIDNIKVTNARYRHCFAAGVCSQPPTLPNRFQLPSDYAANASFDDFPAIVTGLQASTYCQWVSKRLPTEAEWEKAARGTDRRFYPWGNEWDQQRVALVPEAVDQHPNNASPYGALDMVGNAAEWTADQFMLYPGIKDLWPDAFHVFDADLKAGRWAVRGNGYGLSNPIAYRVTVRDSFDAAQDVAGFRCVKGGTPTSLEKALVSVQNILPTPVPTIAPAGSSASSNKIYIPAGEFIMGTDEDCQPTSCLEGPAHIVYLDAFYIDRTEVTYGEYVRFLNILRESVGGSVDEYCNGHLCTSFGGDDTHIRSDGQRFTLESEKYNEYPAQAVTWYGANAYCQWVGGQLPTEAEWEKAARGTDGRLFPWGNNQRNDLIAPANNPGPVGTRPENVSPYGVLDMLGFAQEWTADYFDKGYYQHSSYSNPLGAEWSTAKTIRAQRSRLGVTRRFSDTPDSAPLYTGFRCAYTGPRYQ